MLVRSVGQSIVAMPAASTPTFADSLGGDSFLDSLRVCAGAVSAGAVQLLSANGSRGAALASGHQTRTPISCNMARWRWSRSRLIVAFSQTQAHHHRIFTLTLAAGVIIFAQANPAVTMALVNLERPQVALAHLQPEPVGALTFGPDRQRIEHDTGPALTLILGRQREVEQMNLVHSFHGHKIAKQNIPGQQQLGLVARLQRVGEVGAQPGIRIGPLLDPQDSIQ